MEVCCLVAAVVAITVVVVVYTSCLWVQSLGM